MCLQEGYRAVDCVSAARTRVQCARLVRVRRSGGTPGASGRARGDRRGYQYRRHQSGPINIVQAEKGGNARGAKFPYRGSPTYRPVRRRASDDIERKSRPTDRARPSATLCEETTYSCIRGWRLRVRTGRGVQRPRRGPRGERPCRSISLRTGHYTEALRVWSSAATSCSSGSGAGERARVMSSRASTAGGSARVSKWKPVTMLESCWMHASW